MDHAEQSIRDLRQLYVCHVCNGYAPVIGFGCMCDGEHVTCAPCYHRLEPSQVGGDGITEAITFEVLCPECRRKVQSARAGRLWMETAALMEWPCTYRTCTFVGSLVEAQQHIKVCTFRDVSCPVTHCTVHWRRGDVSTAQSGIPTMCCTPYQLFSMVQRDHPDIPVVTRKKAVLAHCVLAKPDEAIPTQGATWGVVMQPRGSDSDHRVYIEIELDRREKTVQVAAFYLHDPSELAMQDPAFVTHVFVSLGGRPGDEDNDPYMRRIPVVRLDHVNELPRRQMFSVGLDHVADEMENRDDGSIYYMSKRARRSSPQYINVTLHLLHNRALPGDDEPVEVELPQITVNGDLIHKKAIVATPAPPPPAAHGVRARAVPQPPHITVVPRRDTERGARATRGATRGGMVGSARGSARGGAGTSTSRGGGAGNVSHRFMAPRKPEAYARNQGRDDADEPSSSRTTTAASNSRGRNNVPMAALSWSSESFDSDAFEAMMYNDNLNI